MSITPGSSLPLRAKYLQRQHHARGIRGTRWRTIPYGQRCETGLSSEWLPFCFDPIFRWLQEVVIPRNPDNLDFLQPIQCAYADDLAVASCSFLSLMTALAPAFRSVDYIAGLTLNYRKCCLCERGREMQIVRHAKYVGTIIGPRWAPSSLDGTQKKFIQRVMKINASTKSLVERLSDFKIYAISVLSFIGSVCAPDKATLKAENHALQCTTAGPYHAYTVSPSWSWLHMWSWS